MALGDFDLAEPCMQSDQLPHVEPCAGFAGKDELVAFEVAEQRPETTAFTLWIIEAADCQLVRRLAFHLESIRGPAVFIGRIATLGNHPLHRSRHPGPRFGAGNLREVERHPQLDIAQDGAALHRRQQHQVASIQAEGYRKLYLTFGPPQSTAPSGMDFDAPARYIDACDIAIGRKCPMAASHAGSTLLAHPTCSSGSLRGFALASRSGSIPSKPRSFDPAAPVPEETLLIANKRF